jgi:predicted nucleic acid-binding protein
MSVYFDASVIVSMFVKDAFTERAEAFLSSSQPRPVLSDLAATEFASALSLRMRIGTLTADEARAAFLAFDGWMLEETERVECTTFDIRRAEISIRRLDLPLRAPDAIHLAIVQRQGAELATFDRQMTECARTLGLTVAVL